MQNFTMFDPIPLNNNYVAALAGFLTSLITFDAPVNPHVFFYMNGFQVRFDEFEGDIIIHDGSYCSGIRHFESYGFPWDYSDVSTHDPVEMARLINAYARGDDWRAILKEDE